MKNRMKSDFIGFNPKSNGKQSRGRASRPSIYAAMRSTTYGDVPSDYRLTRYAEAMEVSIWAFAAVVRISSALAQTDFRVVNRNTNDDAKGRNAKHVRETLDHVNDSQTKFEFIQQAFVNDLLFGEIAVEKARDPSGRTVEFHHLPPDHLDVTPGTDRLIEGFATVFNGKKFPIDRNNVIFLKTPNPKKWYRGLSPISSVANSIGADSQAALYNLSLLLNGGRPGGILTPTEGDLSDVDYRRLKKQFEQKGPGNAGKFLVLPTGFKFERDVNTMRDMDFASLRKFTREEVSAAFGAAPMLVQNFDSATYANSEQQLKAFWDYVGKPALKRFFGGMNEFWVHTEVDDSISIVPDLVGIDAMVDSEKSKVESASRLLTAGMITINEARKRVGEKPLPDGDRLMMPLNLIPVEPGDIGGEYTDNQPPEGEGGGGPSGEGGGQVGGGFPDSPSPSAAASPLRLSAKERAKEMGRRIHLTDLREAESKLETVSRRWYSNMISRVAGRIEAEEDVPSPGALLDAGQEAERAYQPFASAGLSIIREFGLRTLRRLGYTRTTAGWRAKHRCLKAELPPIELDTWFSLENDRVRGIIEDILFRNIRTATGTMLDEIKILVGESIEEGYGPDRIASRLRSRFTQRSSYWAQRIARTEAVGLANLATNQAFQAAQVPRRSWMTAGDGKVRFSHEQADGQIITANGKYRLFDPEEIPSEAEVEFPGDQSCRVGWAVIQCRCGELPEQEEGIGLTLDYVLTGMKDLKL